MDVCKSLVSERTATVKDTDFQKIKDIFTAVTETPFDHREEVLLAQCGEDEDLLAEVRSLLAIHDEPEHDIEQQAFDLDSLTAGNGKAYEGKYFGHYKIIREIGVGGMGAVFLAERTDGEFEHQVAIKIVRQTLVSSDLERHFRRERQILASLNHPNIAQLLDGGVSENGEPFFVMEYVEGKTLTAFAEQLSINEKLGLFLKICAAVAFAHRNLVVHRDLKPSNILVTKNGVPKLLDFGLAKLSETDSSTGNAGTTQTAFRALTPAYASPEQIRGNKVTTSSDVYSLGVILYELLSGDKPFSVENKNLEEIMLTITASEPLPPSAVIERSPVLHHQLKGDLDNIVLMAMRKESDRRYSSVEVFAHDIERHLHHLPVNARPLTIRYRAAKYIQRNRIAAIAASLILIAIFTGSAIALIQYRQTRKEREKAEAINTFLQKMLLTALPQGKKSGYSSTINDMLEQATKRLDGNDLDSQPDVKAELAETIGTAYLNQGQYDLADKYLKMALAVKTEVFGPKSTRLLSANVQIASLYVARSNYDEADKLYGEILPLARSELAANRLEPVVMADALNNYALLRRARGDSARAEKLYRESISVVSSNPDANTNQARTMIALTLLDQGKFEESEVEVRKLMAESVQASGPETVEIANELTLLGSILMEQGRLTESAESLRSAEKIYKQLLGPNNIATFDNLRLQAQVLYLSGNYAEAQRLIEQVLDNYRQNANPKYISFASALTVQGLILTSSGKIFEAEKVLRVAADLRAENLPPGHFMTALTDEALGVCLTTQHRYADARPLLQTSYDSLRQSQGDANIRTRRVLAYLENLPQ